MCGTAVPTERVVKDALAGQGAGQLYALPRVDGWSGAPGVCCRSLASRAAGLLNRLAANGTSKVAS